MKLFLVLYIGAHVGGYWGPLPYSMNECHERVMEYREKLNTAIATGRSTNGKNEIIPAEHLERMKKTMITCELRREAPVVNLE